MATAEVHDAHRHLGLLPAHPSYGGPAINADLGARAGLEQLLDDLDAEAMALLRRRRPDVRLVLAGGDTLFDYRTTARSA